MVAIIKGPCWVCIFIAKVSSLKLSSNLYCSVGLIAIATPSVLVCVLFF